MKRIVIVGATAAGLAAAETLRREGYDGTLTLIGDEPHQSYDRPPLPKQFLTGRWTSGQASSRPRADLDALGLDLRLGTAATGLDPVAHTVRPANRSAVPCDALVPATGVRGRRLPGKDAHALRTLDDALTLRDRLGPGRRLVVVGAAFLGAEATGTAAGIGADVILLGPAPVLPTTVAGTEVGRVLSLAHLQQGTQPRTRAVLSEATEAKAAPGDSEVVDGGEGLVTIGSHPDTEWLAVRDRVACDACARSRPACTRPGTWPAGRTRRSRCTRVSSSAPTPPFRA